jgi:hypothetical protein
MSSRVKMSGNTPWDYIVTSIKALPDVDDDSECLKGFISSKPAIQNSSYGSCLGPR